MRTKSATLSSHSQKVLDLLHKSAKPLSAYEMLDKLKRFGIKAPPTIYRALETLTNRGLVHRIESLNAFVACNGTHTNHHTKFAICRSCGTALEIDDPRLCSLIHEMAHKLKFHIEQEMLELLGRCQNCVTEQPEHQH